MNAELPADAVGHVMDPGVIALRAQWTVSKTVDMLRSAPQESLYYLYVTDSDNRLVGVLSMRHLLLAQPQERLDAIMFREVTSVRQDMSREKVLELAEQKKFVALPVVDAEGRLVGAIRPGDLIAIAEAEAGSVLQRMFGAGADEHALSPVVFAVKKRLPWLQVNLGTAFLAAAVVALFESTLDRITALAVLYPIVASQGANTGMQALAVVMRGMGAGELRGGAAWRVMAKESLLGLVNGAAVALVAALGVLAWYRDWRLGGIMAVALVMATIVAGLSGAAIPLLMKALGRDPAQSSSIIMTTVTDVVGFACFLGLAAAMMRG